MAGPNFSKKTHILVPEVSTAAFQENPSKSSHSRHLLCKSLVVVFVLVVIPLFPSQAPDFVNQSIVSKFWELLHLLFIGIAVSYGLFCRRTAQMGTETHASNAYLSGIAHVSSVFEDGFENLTQCDEKEVLNEQQVGEKYRSCVSDNGYEFNKNRVTETWNYEYLQGQSMVVVSNGNNFDCSIAHKPLNLPIRSLRSRIVDGGKLEQTDRSTSSSRLTGFSERDDSCEVQRIRGVVPRNLGKKFEEAAKPSPIKWRSRSGRMETREEMSTFRPPAHCRPHSVGDYEFGHLSCGSSSSPVSSGASRESLSSRSNFDMCSDTRELSNMEVKFLDKENGRHGSSLPVSPSDVAPKNLGKSFTTTPWAWPSSLGPTSEMNMQNGFIGSQKDLGNSRRRDPLDGGNQSLISSNASVKPSNFSKVLSRGKSVRTIRSGKNSTNKAKLKEQRAVHSEEMGNVAEECESSLNVRAEEPEQFSVEISNNKLGQFDATRNSELPNYQLRNKDNYTHPGSAVSAVDSDRDAEYKAGLEDREYEGDESVEQKQAKVNMKENLEAEEAVSDHDDDDEELAGSEVDRKAGEFIAKFREQIRLQKVASMRKDSCW